MVESKPVAPSEKYKHKTPKKVDIIKMKVIENLKKETANQQIKENIDIKASATTYGANNYNDIKKHLEDHQAVIQDKRKTSENTALGAYCN
ncbi:hypothetical protein [Aquimarina sp. RZ0]|uniref:hypothetical protein n=1 Tax=Aquimarina sp. RZ0 TaxID=2607730 RepID=UPI0011F18D8C|nr:hypothetical protein [Aquimarina sp. RZ0]KAA1242464.1 hypothetical protein F0000_25430 [Aquimarina sp. RZ0]